MQQTLKRSSVLHALYTAGTDARMNKLPLGAVMGEDAAALHLGAAASAIINEGPKTLGNLKFKGWERMTPEQVCAFYKNKRISYESVHTDATWYNMVLEYDLLNGTETIRHGVLLPYNRKGGRMTIRDNASWHMNFVSADKRLSSRKYPGGLGNIFLRLTKIKGTVHHRKFTVKTADETGQYRNASIDIFTVDIYITDSKGGIPNFGKPTLTHYLLTEWGLHGTIAQVLGPGVDLIVSQTPPPKEEAADYIVVTTVGRKPSNRVNPTLKVSKVVNNAYTPHSFCLSIRRDQVVGQEELATNLLGSIIYILDVFPDTTMDELLSDDTDYWVYQLGIVSMGKKAPGMLFKNIQAHLANKRLDLDSLMKRTLREEFGDTLESDLEHGLFSLFVVLIKKAKEWIAAGDEVAASGYDKKFTFLPFLLERFTINMNKVMQDLTRKELRGQQPIDHKTLARILSTRLSYKLIRGLHIRNPVLTNKQSVNDCFGLKENRDVHTQVNLPSSSPGNDNANGATNPLITLHASHLVCGTLTAISNSRLSALMMPNIYAQLTAQNTIKRTSSHASDLKMLEKVLSNHFDDTPEAYRTRI